MHADKDLLWGLAAGMQRGQCAKSLCQVQGCYMQQGGGGRASTPAAHRLFGKLVLSPAHQGLPV